MNGIDERNLLERGGNNTKKPSRRDYHIIIWESQILLWELNLTNKPTKPSFNPVGNNKEQKAPLVQPVYNLVHAIHSR
jgi:hypothetical protein